MKWKSTNFGPESIKQCSCSVCCSEELEMFVQKRMERCGRNVLTEVPPRGDGSNRYSTSEMIGVRNQTDHQMTTHSFAINGHFISINESQIFFQVSIFVS